MKKFVAGILAHVDAGKTTLTEGLLYLSGSIRRLGRVDHKDAFLDTDNQERERGITIFSKQAEMVFGDIRIMLLDTPGHVDFSAEMERTLQVLDYAIMVINGREGVQAHTVTLWKLLEDYGIPVFLFVNKMDMDGSDRESLMSELKEQLSDCCVDFNGVSLEEAALCDEELLDGYLKSGDISDKEMAGSIKARHIFPCYFGSALKLEGVKEFIEGLERFTSETSYGDEFSARVYKITRDAQGGRLTHMKITGGSLKVKDVINEEKINQIRVYSGEKFRTESEAEAGTVCAVLGMNQTYAGQGLGKEGRDGKAVLEPALSYSVIFDESLDSSKVLFNLKQLEEEEPQLHVVWNEQLKSIKIQLMGEIQMEVLKNIMLERFKTAVEFGEGSISYRETIKSSVVGSGHFEPLRHYAEVHLLLEPGEPGSGLVFSSRCSEDVLDKNWQRLIMTHLGEKQHIGVLTGSPITDMKISLLAGRAHIKHTEGGDFRQATYRALAQGLRKAESVLLEPWYEFRLELPSEFVGRAMSDIQKMGGSFNEPEMWEGVSLLKGKAPVSEMNGYSGEVSSYTRGFGHLSCVLSGYEPCHNQEEIIEAIGYDPNRDGENTGDSVFCTGGSGVTVKWDEADELFHVEHGWKGGGGDAYDNRNFPSEARRLEKPKKDRKAEEKELQRIFEMTYGKPKERRRVAPKVMEGENEKKKTKPQKLLEEYLLVDGYNIIFAWEELKAVAEVSLDGAREALLEILENYQGYKKCKVIAVFDAYKVKGGERRHEKHGEIQVVFTKEAETADTYIEKASHELGGEYLVRVATSDNLEQLIVTGNGAFRVSADEFKAEVESMNKEISLILEEHSRKNRLKYKNSIEINK